MKGMIMAYSLAVVSTSGITTSTTVYEFYLLLIYAMTTLTNVILLPMIKILFVLKIINHISKEEHFSRLCKTLEGVIKFLLKGFLSVLLGVQLIQSMILPAVDSMKKYSSAKRNECNSRNRKWFKFSHDNGHRFSRRDQKQYWSRWNPCTDRDHRSASSRDHSGSAYLSVDRYHDPANIRQKNHRSNGCSYSKREINAFDDLYDGTVIYLVRGIDRILNQR